MDQYKMTSVANVALCVLNDMNVKIKDPMKVEMYAAEL